MKTGLMVAICLLLPHEAWARHAIPPADRAAFRQAVEEYQMFVVPHCAPDDVRAYVAARSERDQAFVRSLRKSELAADYEQAVADRAARDRSTVYECMGPPPPPGTIPSVPDPAEIAAKRRASLTAHFDAGDRQFTSLVQLRDQLIGPPKKR